MRITTKFTIGMLFTALIPLLIAMGIALWKSTGETSELTIHKAQGYLAAAAAKLSGYFSSRISEITAYSEMPLVKSMSFAKIRPFLVSELDRHNGIYEKFIFSTPNGHFYNTAGGNPALGGLRTFNDKNPAAKPKSIVKRDYWQATVGNNVNHNKVTIVSDPMISYTTGAKQVVVAASILSPQNNVVGMIGGALPWQDIEKRLNNLFDELLGQLNWDAKFFVVSNTGTFWYHWEQEKVVHLKLDELGEPILNEIGEKQIVKTNIQNDSILQIAQAGKQIIAGKKGYIDYYDPDSGEKNVLVYMPIANAKYSIGLVVPQHQLLESVKHLEILFLVALALAVAIIFIVSWLVSKKVTAPLVTLNSAAKEISQGNWQEISKNESDDEIFELTDSFNNMVSSLKKREDSLRASEERFSLAMQGANDGLWDWNIQTNTVYYSPRWASMLGYNSVELDPSLKTWKALIHPDDSSRCLAYAQDFINDNIHKYELSYRMKHNDGHYVDILSRAFALRDESNRAIRIVGTHVDISKHKQQEIKIKQLNEELEQRIESRTLQLETTNKQLKEEISERRQIENALRDREILLRQTGHIAKVGGWKLPLDSMIPTWTEETYHIHELPVGQKPTLEQAIEFYLPEYRPAIQHAVQQAIDKQQQFDLELQIITAKKNVIWVRTIGAPEIENDKVTALVGIFQDITELKNVERMKKEFVSTVSHELRTPLTSIHGSIGLLKGGVAGDISQQAMELLTVAERNSERLLHLINDLLDMEKIEAGSMSFHMEKFPLMELLNQSLIDNKAYADRYESKIILINTELTEYVQVDKDRFMQVMSNLLSNAVKFSPRRSTIEVSIYKQDHESIRICVRDFGSGIPTAFREKIFTKFSQADSSDSRVKGGTGLGLSISKSIIETMHGTIGFKSHNNSGTTFYFDLPYFPAESQQPQSHTGT